MATADKQFCLSKHTKLFYFKIKMCSLSNSEMFFIGVRDDVTNQNRVYGKIIIREFFTI